MVHLVKYFKLGKTVKLQYLSKLVDKVQITQTCFKWSKRTTCITSFTGSTGKILNTQILKYLNSKFHWLKLN